MKSSIAYIVRTNSRPAAIYPPKNSKRELYATARKTLSAARQGGKRIRCGLSAWLEQPAQLEEKQKEDKSSLEIF